MPATVPVLAGAGIIIFQPIQDIEPAWESIFGLVFVVMGLGLGYRISPEALLSYEINLVLTDGSRLNLVDHSIQSVIREDAQTLGAFLDVPVWDASSFPAHELPAALSARD
jgi:hypothetical protein